MHALEYEVAVPWIRIENGAQEHKKPLVIIHKEDRYICHDTCKRSMDLQ